MPHIFAKYLGLPTYSMPPSIITLEKSKFDFSAALVIVISQSGVSKDLIECEESVRKMGGKTLIISNNTNSPMINHSHFFFNLNADKEKSVAATKTFVMTLLVLLKLTFYSASKKKINSLIEPPREVSNDNSTLLVKILLDVIRLLSSNLPSDTNFITKKEFFLINGSKIMLQLRKLPSLYNFLFSNCDVISDFSETIFRLFLKFPCLKDSFISYGILFQS